MKQLVVVEKVFIILVVGCLTVVFVCMNVERR